MRKLLPIFAFSLYSNFAYSAIVIDSFDGFQSATTSSTYQQTNVLGGERELHLFNASMTVDNGSLDVQLDGSGEGWIIYDGIDMSAFRNSSGLNSLDLTSGGTNDAFLLKVDSASSNYNIRIWVYDNDSGIPYIYQSPSLDSIQQDLLISFTDIPSGVDMANVGLILINFESESSTPMEIRSSSFQVVPESSSLFLLSISALMLCSNRRRSPCA